MGKVHNVGRLTVRRGRAVRSDAGPIDAYINNLFRADENKLPKSYTSTDVMRRGQAKIVGDLRGPIAEGIREAMARGRDAIRDTAEEFEAFRQDLVSQTPVDPDGPNDPPYHAFEAWKLDFYPNSKGTFTMTIYNPKDYLPFLEEGWSPQAPAGWIMAAWLLFKTRLTQRLGNG